MKKIISVLKDKKSFDIPPVWFMRQAGRYLPEYNAVRKQNGGFLDMVYNPLLACEISMQPIRRYNLDNLILFSDILVIPHAIGQDLEFCDQKGPILGKLDIESLEDDLSGKAIENIFESLRLIAKTLERENYNDVSITGFAGSPWTVACFMIAGKSPVDCIEAREFAYKNQNAFEKLIKVIETATIKYISRQIESGAEIIQLFESKAGFASGDLFDEYVIKPNARIIKSIKEKYPHIPVIGFPLGAGKLYPEYIKQTNIDCVSVDYFHSPEEMREFSQIGVAVQGNLDPAIVLAGSQIMIGNVKNILNEMIGIPFVFNLGHGMHKMTPPENVVKVLELIRE